MTDLEFKKNVKKSIKEFKKMKEMLDDKPRTEKHLSDWRRGCQESLEKWEQGKSLRIGSDLEFGGLCQNHRVSYHFRTNISKHEMLINKKGEVVSITHGFRNWKVSSQEWVRLLSNQFLGMPLYWDIPKEYKSTSLDEGFLLVKKYRNRLISEKAPHLNKLSRKKQDDFISQLHNEISLGWVFDKKGITELDFLLVSLYKTFAIHPIDTIKLLSEGNTPTSLVVSIQTKKLDLIKIYNDSRAKNLTPEAALKKINTTIYNILLKGAAIEEALQFTDYSNL
jgi:hypothetical protein